MHTSITIQPGHVPRTTGSTGTIREQEFTAALGVELASRLRHLGWDVHVVPADPPGRRYPDTDLFLALHADGSGNPNVGSASFFFPPRDAVEGLAWGIHWAARHQAVAGYRFGFRDPNYVGAVSTGFYAWRADRVRRGIATPADTCLLAEHYFATNPEEAEWAWTPGRIALMAQAHVEALGAWNGHPTREGTAMSTMMMDESTPPRVWILGTTALEVTDSGARQQHIDDYTKAGRVMVAKHAAAIIEKTYPDIEAGVGPVDPEFVGVTAEEVQAIVVNAINSTRLGTP